MRFHNKDFEICTGQTCFCCTAPYLGPTNIMNTKEYQKTTGVALLRTLSSYFLALKFWCPEVSLHSSLVCMQFGHIILKFGTSSFGTQNSSIFLVFFTFTLPFVCLFLGRFSSSKYICYVDGQMNYVNFAPFMKAQTREIS